MVSVEEDLAELLFIELRDQIAPGHEHAPVVQKCFMVGVPHEAV